MYIFWFLHQTTTCFCSINLFLCCISFDSYIKPQPLDYFILNNVRCISFDSYIKPQPMRTLVMKLSVVYLLIPTSNHNEKLFKNAQKKVVYLLIPTSNHNSASYKKLVDAVVYLLIPTSNHNRRLFYHYHFGLYIFWFLHQTTTKKLKRMLLKRCISFDSYIKPQPSTRMSWQEICCISFDSYIKPQLLFKNWTQVIVVYLLIPTSNHN